MKFIRGAVVSLVALVAIALANASGIVTISNGSRPVAAAPGGGGDTPAWISALTASRWAVAGGPTITAVAPSPLPPGTVPPSESGAVPNVIAPWSGGVADPDDLFVWGGGHTDYGGNEVYSRHFGATLGDWQLFTQPSDTNGGSPATGVYGDGQPRAYHSWGMMAYAANTQELWITGMPGPYHPVGQNQPHVFRFDNTAHAWVAMGTHPNGTGAALANEGASVYDPVSGLIYNFPQSNFIFTIDPQTGSMSTVGSIFIGGYKAVAIATTLRCVVSIGVDGEWVYNITNNTVHELTTSGSGPSFDYRPGVVWHARTARALVYAGGATVYTFTPPVSNPCSSSGTWAWGTLTNVGGGVTPSVAAEGGTGGRFAIFEDVEASNEDVLFVINRVGENGWLYRLP